MWQKWSSKSCYNSLMNKLRVDSVSDFKEISKFKIIGIFDIQFNSVQSLSHVQLFATPWSSACQASLSITNSRSSLKLMSIESVMPSSHLILCCPLLLLPLIPPSIRVFSNESTLHMRWPKYWNFIFSISPSNEHSGLISFRMDWLDLLAVQRTLIELWNIGWYVWKLVNQILKNWKYLETHFYWAQRILFI